MTMSDTATSRRRYLYGALELSSKCRVIVPSPCMQQQQKKKRGAPRGVSFVELLPEHAHLCPTSYVCRVEPRLAATRATDVWAKCSLLREHEHENDARADDSVLELVEVLGPVGDAHAEERALLGRFGILPCRYPSSVLTNRIRFRPQIVPPATSRRRSWASTW